MVMETGWQLNQNDNGYRMVMKTGCIKKLGSTEI